MSAPYDYKALIDDIAADTPCQCQNCEWTGGFAGLAPIGDCALTPGDPSPAGRCPECDTLAYVVKPEPLDALLPAVLRLIAKAEARDRKMDDPRGDGSGDDAVAPTGDDYNDLMEDVQALADVYVDLTFADEALLAQAREKYAAGSDDDIEIDELAPTSEGDEGVWVQAWVWLRYPEVDEDAEDHRKDCEDGMHSWVDDNSVHDGVCKYCGEPYGDPS